MNTVRGFFCVQGRRENICLEIRSERGLREKRRDIDSGDISGDGGGGLFAPKESSLNGSS